MTISKHDLRKDARARRAALAAAAPDFATSLARFADALDLPESAIVASYWPIRDEADPRALADVLAAKGHAIALPRVHQPDDVLEFRLWRAGDALSPNRHGIHEPLPHRGAVRPSIVLVPVLAFDAEGARLGYGGGYYDRTLAHLRAAGHIVAIGVAYAGQEMTGLPHDPHDQRLDKVVTEKGVRIFGKQ